MSHPIADQSVPVSSSRPGAACPEHERLLTGKGCYVGDVPLDTALVVTFVRSPLASGRLVTVNIQPAMACTGVRAVFTGKDVATIGPLPVNKVLSHTDAVPYPVLAQHTVQAVGQPIVAIVADSAQAGADAADLIELEFAPVSDEAGGTGAGQTCAMSQQWNQGDVEQQFARAEHVVEASVQHPRLAPSPLETRAIAARYEDDGGRLTIWLSTQTPHRARLHLAGMLDVDIGRLRVIAPDVGGAFGMKASLYPEEVLVAWAALRLGRSVRWQASRSEDFLAATHGRGGRSHGRLALAADGRFLALEADVECPLGYWLPNSASIPAWNAARILPGPYRCEAVRLSTQARLSHTAPVGIYRGAGRPEAAALMERLVEKAALATGLDSLEIRRRNVIPTDQMPWQGPADAMIDSGRFLATLAQLADQPAYARLMKDAQRRRARGELVGVGSALYVEPCGRGWESATVSVDPDGRITAATGGSAQGQSRVRVLAKLVAEIFGVAPERVKVLMGDTETCPSGIGALASRSTPIGGSAMRQAAVQAHEQLLSRPAGAPPRTDTLSVSVNYEVEGEAWGNGAYLAVVSIDADTGKPCCEDLIVVDDIGNMLDEELVRDQILGGIAQGVGEALLEQIIYDENGQLLTGSLMDYALPRADDMPTVHLSSLSTPSPFNELGAKGVGEAGTIGAPAAISNAVHNALAGLSSEDIPMPFTAARLWQLIHSARFRETHS